MGRLGGALAPPTLHTSAHRAAAWVVVRCRMSGVVGPDSSRNTHCSTAPWGMGGRLPPDVVLPRRLRVPAAAMPPPPAVEEAAVEEVEVGDGVAPAQGAAGGTGSDREGVAVSVGPSRPGAGAMLSITRDNCWVSY